MRDLDTLCTFEMTPEEKAEFKRLWIEQYAIDLKEECGDEDPLEERMETAKLFYGEYLNQEGYTGRDEDIMMARERKKNETPV